MTTDDKIELLNRTVVVAFEKYEKAIVLCLNEDLSTQALILLYSAIDLAGWLNIEGKASRKSFERWVEEFMLLASDLSCTATELYAARCGVVHTHAPESDLSRVDPRPQGRDGEVENIRELYYAWGGQANDLQCAIDNHGKGNEILAVQGQTVVKAYQAGISRFLKEIQSSPDCLARVHHKAAKLFISKDMSPEVREIIDWEQKVLWAALMDQS